VIGNGELEERSPIKLLALHTSASLISTHSQGLRDGQPIVRRD
jgi:hypothetical protein